MSLQEKIDRSEDSPELRIPRAKWGLDHASVLLYVETRAVDYRGLIDVDRMRCNPRRHPFLEGRAAGLAVKGRTFSSPTRLRNGEKVAGHDDWDCLDDIIAEGLAENTGTGVNVRVRLTDEGWKLVHAVRRHRAENDTVIAPFNFETWRPS